MAAAAVTPAIAIENSYDDTNSACDRAVMAILRRKFRSDRINHLRVRRPSLAHILKVRH